MKQATLALALLVGLTATVRAEDAPSSPPAAPPVPAAPSPSKPAPPATPEQAADAVLAAVAAKDDAALNALASKDAPDPWLVADELIRREQHDAAEAFARAAPRVDVELLPAYVASRRGKPDDPARRERLAKANVALAARRAADALAALGAQDPAPAADVVGGRLLQARAAALAALARLDEAIAVGTAAAEAFERLGWWLRVAEGLQQVAAACYQAGRPPQMLEACTRAVSVGERRQDRAFVARMRSNIGLAHRYAGAYALAVQAFRDAVSEAEKLGDRAGVGAGLLNLGVTHLESGDWRAAVEPLERSLAIRRSLADRVGTARALAALGGALGAGGDRAAARAALREASDAFEAVGDLEGVASCALELAGLEGRAGRLPEAAEQFERAGRAFQSVGNRLGWATALAGVGSVRLLLGEVESGIDALARAAAAQREVGSLGRAASTTARLASALAERGDYGRALAELERCRATFAELGDVVGASRVDVWTASVQKEIGRLEEPLTLLSGSLGVFRSHGLTDDALQALGNRGDVLVLRGELARALADFEEVLTSAEASGNRVQRARALLAVANVAILSGNVARAQSSLEGAATEFVAMGMRFEAAMALSTRGLALHDAGSTAEALELHDRAASEFESLHAGRNQANSLVRAGIALRSLGRLDDALVAFERARDLARAAGDPEGTALATYNEADVHLAGARFERARTLLDETLDLSMKTGNALGEARALASLGRVAAAKGLHREALARAREAVAKEAFVVRGLGLADGSEARASVATAAEVGLRAALALGDVAAFAAFAERSISGALNENLNAPEATRAAALPDVLLAEDAKFRAAEARAVAALRKALEGGDLAATKARRTELQAAQEQVAAVVSRIQREAKAGAAIVYPEAATLDEVRATLEAGDVLVLYALFEAGDAAALVVERDGARIATLGPRAPIDAAAEAASEALADDASDPAAALSALADLVVKPLALGEGTKRVLVSPTGTLSYVPFAALIPDRTVVYVPSGTTYRLLREEEGLRGEAVLALGDPDYTTKVDERALAVHRGAAGKLVRLPATRDEALAIGTTTLLGADATEAGLRKALAERKRWRAVHLACHGLVNTERPALSSLAITAAGDDDGFLTCLDVFRLKVPADLVVLSACETGRGKVVKGEGIVGLTRAFMFAGSPRVLCSLWKVDDAATAALMTKFYELWNPKDGKPGLPSAEALRAAQAHVRSQEKWKHPYYWAAWVLWGLPS